MQQINNLLYYYKIADFTVASTFEFSLLLTRQTKVIETAKVIYFRLGEIPLIDYSKGWKVGVTYAYSEMNSECLIDLPNIAQYYIQPQEVIVKPFTPDWATVQLFLLTSALPVLLHYQGQTPLLASSFLKDDELVLVTGKNGHGKSTLTAAMAKKGFEVFSDDLISLSLSGLNEIQAVAIHSNIFLWKDSIEQLRENQYHFLNPVREGIAKYVNEIPAQKQDKQIKVAKIIILTSSGKPHSITECSKMDALQSINDFVPYSMLLETPLAQKRNFLLMGALINQIPVFQANRCIKNNAPDFIDFITHAIS